MKIESFKSTKKASILTKDNIVYKVSHNFLQLVGYKDYEVVNKSLEELSILLKMKSQINFEDIKDVENLFIFNNEGLAKDVTINCEIQDRQKEKIYHIQENLNSTLQVLLLNYANEVESSDAAQAIYSYPDLICLKFNKKYIDSLDLMTIKHDNLIGSYHPNPKYLSQIVETGFFHENKVEYVNQNGISSYWDANIKLIHGNEENIFLISTLYNVTDKVLEKKALEKERLEMKIILDNISDPIDKVNKKGEFTYIHKRAKDKLSAYSHDVPSLTDKDRYKFFKYNDINGNEISFKNTPIQRVLRGETVTDEIIIETNLPNINDRLPTNYYQCNGVPIYDQEGNLDGGVLIYKDVKHIFKINEYSALRENIQGVFLRYASLSYDNFKIKYINEAAMEMVIKNNPEVKLEIHVIGRNFFDFYYLIDMERDELIKEVRKSIENKESYFLKQKIIENGEIKYIKTIFHPTYDEKGKCEKIEVVDVYVTDEEKAKDEINTALKIQDEMFINISHELKTPLNLIYSSSQLLNMYLDKLPSTDTREDIEYSNEIIMQNCYRLTKLINNILDISKIESGFFELNLMNVDIVYSTRRIVKSVAQCNKANELEIRFNTNVKKLIIPLDIYKIERVLLNLISNSIKFSKDKGSIVVNLEAKDTYVEISVEDKGIGIKKEDLDIIFEKYRQVNRSLNRISEGNGIGLSLVKSIVELHGGSVRVESIFDQGSIFTIKLPIKTLHNKYLSAKENNDNKIEMIKFELSDIY